MSKPLALTVGETGGKEIAIITEGGHPQVLGSGDCKIVAIELVSEMPDETAEVWFERMKNERPWETRQ